MRLNRFKSWGPASKSPTKRPIVGRTSLARSPGQFAVALCAVFSLLVAAILALARVGNTKTSFESGALRVATFTQSKPAPAGFIGYKWGDPPPAVHTKALVKVLGPNHEGLTAYSVKRTGSLLGLPVKEEGYWFSHGGFFEGVAWVANDQSLKAAKAALRKALGPPSFSSERLQLWKWHWPQTGVTAQLKADTSIQISIWNDAVHPVNLKIPDRKAQRSR
jgi:hypothetical protein